MCPNIAQHIHASKMLSLGVWGTEGEIFAMATILNATIYVYSKCGEENTWLPYKSLKSGDSDKNGE